MSHHLPGTGWLQTKAGSEALRARSATASAALLNSDLSRRIVEAHRQTLRTRKAIRTLDPLLRAALEEMQILALAGAHGLPVSPAAWKIADAIVSLVLRMDSLSCQGRFARPAWKADLSTADLGVALAFLAVTPSPLADRHGDISAFLRTRCWEPSAGEWLADRTRIHSLDSMGHNWWSVIVGGAGIVAALLGWKTEAARALKGLADWFRYPGNIMWRKHPNFGPEGDFVEGFLYCDYALIHPLILGALTGVSVVPDWLDQRQCDGLASWYRRGFLTTRKGYWPRRFGDTGIGFLPQANVWHTLAGWAGDHQLLDLAHQMVPLPRHPLDFLFWRKNLSGSRVRKPEPKIFPTSGYAFLGGKRLSVSVRAGEFWNHNHLDAGSFILAQDDSVWVDDAGTCPYSSPDYISYYSSPGSHNVAYSPALVPPMTGTKELGLDLGGKFLAHAQLDDVEFLHVDTRVLSGGSLLRSRRTFLLLDADLTIVWDDLEARQPERFESLLHTTQSAKRLTDHRVRLQDGATSRCGVFCFSDGGLSLSIQPAKMGAQAPAKDSNGAPRADLPGSCLRWRSSGKTRRRKFLVALGTRLRTGEWKEESAGWEARFSSGRTEWTVWFNRRADGRIAHRNSLSAWRQFETDAYALVLRRESLRSTLYACSASFVRHNGKSLHESLRRTHLASHPLKLS